MGSWFFNYLTTFLHLSNFFMDSVRRYLQLRLKGTAVLMVLDGLLITFNSAAIWISFSPLPFLVFTALKKSLFHSCQPNHCPVSSHCSCPLLDNVDRMHGHTNNIADAFRFNLCTKQVWHFLLNCPSGMSFSMISLKSIFDSILFFLYLVSHHLVQWLVGNFSLNLSVSFASPLICTKALSA